MGAHMARILNLNFAASTVSKKIAAMGGMCKKYLPCDGRPDDSGSGVAASANTADAEATNAVGPAIRARMSDLPIDLACSDDTIAVSVHEIVVAISAITSADSIRYGIGMDQSNRKSTSSCARGMEMHQTNALKLISASIVRTINKPDDGKYIELPTSSISSSFNPAHCHTVRPAIVIFCFALR